MKKEAPVLKVARAEEVIELGSLLAITETRVLRSRSFAVCDQGKWLYATRHG